MMHSLAPQARPSIDRRFSTPTYDVEFHLDGCECPHCADGVVITDDRLGLRRARQSCPPRGHGG